MQPMKHGRIEWLGLGPPNSNPQPTCKKPLGYPETGLPQVKIGELNLHRKYDSKSETSLESRAPIMPL